MPLTTYEISIELQKNPAPPFASRVNTADLEAFKQIEALGFKETTGKKGWGRRIRVRCDSNDPRLAKVLALIKDLGFVPTKKRIVPLGRRHREFRPSIWRDYSQHEIAAAPLLRLSFVVPSSDIANWAGTDNDRWVIKVDQLQKNELEIGTLGNLPSFAVSESLKEAMESGELTGAAFAEVGYDRPERVTKRLWQFIPGLEMPPALTPRVDAINGTNAVDGSTEFIAWDDGPAVPAELSFDQRRVEALGTFDIALTRETVGGRTPRFRRYHREIIVSQRVRAFFDSRRILSISYVPVHLT